MLTLFQICPATSRHPLAFTIFTTLLCLGLMPCAQVSANNNHDERERADKNHMVVLPAGEVINQDYFAVGKSIEIFGRVNGDVYAADGHVVTFFIVLCGLGTLLVIKKEMYGVLRGHELI